MPLSLLQVMKALGVVYHLQRRARNNIRVLVLDNCNNPIRIDQDLQNIFAKGELCNEKLMINGMPLDASNVMGVVVSGSRMVVAANRITAPHQIQLIGLDSSSTALSNRNDYPYFGRMVPPDNIQMEVIAKVLQANDWSYVGVIYSQESYGVNGYRNLQKIINDKKYSCIGVAVGVNPYDTSEDIRSAVRTIAAENGVNVIVVIAVNTRQVLEAVEAEGLEDRFVLVGGDAWGPTRDIVKGFERMNASTNMNFQGAITIGFRDAIYEPIAQQPYGFLTFLTSMSPSNRLGLPDAWFEDVYQTIRKCRIAGATVPTEYTEICDGASINQQDIRDTGIGLRPLGAAELLSAGLADFLDYYTCNTKSFAQCISEAAGRRKGLFEKTLEQDWTLQETDVLPQGLFKPELGEDRYWDSGYTVYTLGVKQEPGLPQPEREHNSKYYYSEVSTLFHLISQLY